MSFAVYLRELRHARRVTQPQLAKALGIPLKSLVELESGRRMPSIQELRQIGEVLQVSEHELMLRAGYLAAARHW